MKHIKIILSFFMYFTIFLNCTIGQGEQPTKGTGWCYFSGTPTYVPNIEYNCELAWDFVNKKAYYWDRVNNVWVEYDADSDPTNELYDDREIRDSILAHRTDIDYIKIQYKTFSVSAGDEIVTSIMDNKTTSIWVETAISGAEITTSVIDPDNVSTQENAVNNDIYDDLVYNNSSAGTINKRLPGINLGAPESIREIRLYWWTNNTYTASNYEIHGSNDPTFSTYSILASGLNSTGVSGLETINVSGTFQYVTPFVVQGNSEQWATISEIEAFREGSSEKGLISNYIDITAVSENGNVKIINNSDLNITITINYLQ